MLTIIQVNLSIIFYNKYLTFSAGVGQIGGLFRTFILLITVLLYLNLNIFWGKKRVQSYLYIWSQ